MNQFERIPPTGLCNNSCQGCYVNSSVQLLNCIKPFIEYLNKISENDNMLLHRLKMLFVDLYKTTFQSIDTFYFLDCYQPQTGDPNEFLLQILSDCSNCQSLQSIFEYQSTCQCGKQIYFRRNETYKYLYNDGKNIELPELVQSSLLEEHECECGNISFLSPKIVTHPSYLILLVSNGYFEDNQAKKRNQSLTQHRSITYGSHEYHLQSMITHINGYDDGHCRCYVNTRNGWYGCDDTNVYQWNGILDTSANEVVTTFLFKKEGIIDPPMQFTKHTYEEYSTFLHQKQQK